MRNKFQFVFFLQRMTWWQQHDVDHNHGGVPARHAVLAEEQEAPVRGGAPEQLTEAEHHI